MRSRIGTFALVAAFGATSLAALAQTQVATPVPYVTGGIGLDERETMLQQAKQEGYNLKIVAAATGGAYLGGVTVRIVGRDGKQVLQAAMDGPWLYVKLPPGSYTVTADDGEQAHKRATQVPATGLREIVFRWERAVESKRDMEPEPARPAGSP